MFVAGPPPDAAVIMIGANDITALNGISAVGAPARGRGAAAARQRRGGRRRHVPGFRRDHRDSAAAALDGPLARVCGWRGRRPRRCAPPAVYRCRSRTCWTPNFSQTPELMFSEDKFHPSAAGYALAANQLLPALCHALGEWTGATVPDLPWASRTAGRSFTASADAR